MSLKTRSICLICSILSLFLLFFQFSFSQSDFSQVDALVKKNQKILGNDVVALVYKDGKVVHSQELGEFNAKTPAPIASCSKWLTAALVMMFVDEGKLDLDDPVSKYLPVFDKYMKSYVTIRQCLTHTTGIENDKGNLLKMVQRSKFTSLEEEVNTFAAKEISNNAGTEFHYGGIGLNVAGRVLEVITKKPFDRLIQEKLLRPLKMKQTSFMNENGYAPNPSGGARSTANDYINFLSMILSKGMFEGKKILSEKAIEEMEKPQFTNLPVKYTPKVAEGFHYGLGEWIQEEDANGNSTVVSSPGLFGTWPYIDKCRNYAAIIFVKSLLNEQKKDIAMQFKSAVDEVVGGSNCK
ncbi:MULTISPECIES: serine hydrolase domain-containing protein [Niastella]|uniref:Beta-lactamase family protein n=1 Tax=Niastella soli TaxID=2821487 RepID=A0ABS3Z0P4_9BACT|nr:serine hydrolase domain-containing protein [Niastella soli]MBO9203593.1 beta-lactamase family protein [Niastella soli]